MAKPRKTRTKQSSGISDAAMNGAKKGEQQEKPAPDAKTVDPQRSDAAKAWETNEAPMGGGPVAFPAPSAQPSKIEPEDQDDDQEWRRAGGDKPSPDRE